MGRGKIGEVRVLIIAVPDPVAELANSWIALCPNAALTSVSCNPRSAQRNPIAVIVFRGRCSWGGACLSLSGLPAVARKRCPVYDNGVASELVGRASQAGPSMPMTCCSMSRLESVIR